MSEILKVHHKPDILDCLANLSSDEVFTSPVLANKMLDLLPTEIWSNPTITILDPGCKSGVFLRECAKRLLEGLREVIPDEKLRREHIFKHMLFGIAITELTSQISRRTLYYCKDASADGSVVKMPTSSGNISYENIAHTYKADICIYCGSPIDFSRNTASLETHAYQFIHGGDIEKMKFDVIIGNPPYQLKDNGHGASASPLYHKFVQQAIALKPKYVCMIIPARWFAGGKGLAEFRQQMLNDRSIRVLVDHADASECFPGVEIKGGVCYFLWDATYAESANKGCLVKNIAVSSQTDEVYRSLNRYDVFIRFNRAVSIVDKVKGLSTNMLDQQVSSRKPFGLATNFVDYSKKPVERSIVLYARGERGWVDPVRIKINPEWIQQWKVLLAMAAEGDGKFPNKITGHPKIAEPGSACTETYLVCGRFNSEFEAKNFESFLKTKFCRFLIGLRKNTQHLTRDRFAFVPVLDMKKNWTDQELYEMYGLTNEETAFIEQQIKEMP